ncbi:MAG: hypothetical protein V3U75_01470 [Methylococcaceae bacterium]
MEGKWFLADRDIDQRIMDAVVDWIDLAHGTFKINDMIRELNYSDRNEIEESKIAIKRLLHAGYLKEHKTQNGSYTKIEANMVKMKRVENKKPHVDLWWPLDLHEKVVIIPGSLIIIAGVSNAGKSAFMLNFVEKNMNNHKIRYVSSEWSNEERDTHLEDFGANIDEWDSRVDFFAKKDTSMSFDNYIDPDSINIIDYFESYDNYGAIAGELRDISDRLKNGIAIVAMQKKSGAGNAYGGEGTVNRSQLYVNIDFNETDFNKRIATIRKLKKATNRKYNIERLSCEFEYDDKGRIVKKTGWGKIIEIKSKGILDEKYIQAEAWANHEKEDEVMAWTD